MSTTATSPFDYELEVRTGQDLLLRLAQLADDAGTPIVDFSGWHLRFRVATSPAAASLHEVTESTASAAFNFLAGNAQFRALTAAQTAALSTARGHLYFDVFLQAPTSGYWSPVAAGRLYLVAGLAAAAA